MHRAGRLRLYVEDALENMAVPRQEHGPVEEEEAEVSQKNQ